VAALYIERDLTGITELRTAFATLLSRHALDVTNGLLGESTQKADNRVRDLLQTMIIEEINTVGIHPARLTLEEKVSIVHRLNDKGAMMIEGAIPEIAKQLLISEPTVYRYLNRMA
jgi:predicted transcriptional regulator YheO